MLSPKCDLPVPLFTLQLKTGLAPVSVSIVLLWDLISVEFEGPKKESRLGGFSVEPCFVKKSVSPEPLLAEYLVSVGETVRVRCCTN